MMARGKSGAPAAASRSMLPRMCETGGGDEDGEGAAPEEDAEDCCAKSVSMCVCAQGL